jgi:transcriptional antiterminator RfaH
MAVAHASPGRRPFLPSSNRPFIEETDDMRDVCFVPRELHWYVLRTHHRQESRAEDNLAQGRIETFLPWLRVRSRRRRPDREPLFPQYLFARFELQASLHDVTFTRGVQSVVRVGGELATVGDRVIEFFRSRTDESGVIAVGRTFTPGERVTIEYGPFADLVGVVERTLPARERVLVLLTTVGPALRVEVPTDHLRMQPLVVTG